MKIQQTRAYQWLWALFHFWKIAKQCQALARQMQYRESVNELPRHGVMITLRGSRSGWYASVGKRYTFNATTLERLLMEIATAE